VERLFSKVPEVVEIGTSSIIEFVPSCDVRSDFSVVRRENRSGVAAANLHILFITGCQFEPHPQSRLPLLRWKCLIPMDH
jgi:hypothetical protein